MDGREFLFQSVDGRSLVPGTQIRLSFDHGRVGASAGCNALGGPYELVDGRLIIRGMSMTEIGCDAARHAQDEWLADLLQSEPRINLLGNTLTVEAAEAILRLLDRVVADPDRPLVGTRWRVDTALRGDAASSVPDTAPVTLEFGDDGTLTASSAGCTSVRVPVSVEAEVLRFGDVVIDTVGCPPPWDATVECSGGPHDVLDRPRPA